MRRIGRSPAQLAGVAALVVLLVAMLLSTKFLTPSELAAAQPKKFNPRETATGLYRKAQTDVAAQAQPLGEVVNALQSDPKAAAAKYKAVSPTEGAYVFPVTATGTVTEATADTLRLKVDGVSPQTTVIVPLGTAINGTVIRDVTGFKFADAPGQTAFQFVGDELKKLMQAKVSSDVADPAALQGKQVTVVGATNVQSTGGPVPKAKPVSVQPLDIKAGS